MPEHLQISRELVDEERGWLDLEGDPLQLRPKAATRVEQRVEGDRVVVMGVVRRRRDRTQVVHDRRRRGLFLVIPAAAVRWRLEPCGVAAHETAALAAPKRPGL